MVKVSVAGKTLADFPDLVKQIDREKQPDLNPKDMAAGSHKRVWWKCPEGPDHEWSTKLQSRTISESGCACCAGKKASVTNSLASLYPNIAAQWHPTKNGDLTPKDTVSQSHKKIWWKCPEGPDHEWETKPNTRISQSQNCPFCPPSPKKVSVTNSLQTKYPEISKEWHPTKNGDLKPKDIISGSHVLFWWKCDKGPDHEWRANPGNRTGRKSNCPCCAGKKVSVTNSLLTLYPDVAKEWHPTKNGELKPKNIVAQSKKKVWWKCDKGPDHEWQATLNGRAGSNRGCPICVGQKVVDSNCLATLNPELAKEWHPTKNGKLTPKEVTIGTGRKVWWKCPKDSTHEWDAGISDRNSGDGCAYCSGHRINRGNSFGSKFPMILHEWDYEKNNELDPYALAPFSHLKVWWKCGRGHEWKTGIANRSVGNGCPQCKLVGTSKIEIRIAFELYRIFDLDYIYSPKIQIGNRSWLPDIMIETAKLVIEYDSKIYHSSEIYDSKEKNNIDKLKTEQLVGENWTVIRIREEPLEKLTDNDITIPYQRYNYKDTVDEVLGKIIDLGIDVPGVQKYLENDRPIAKRAADEYIAELLREAEQETLNF